MENVCEWEESEEGEGPSGQGAAEGKDVSEEAAPLQCKDTDWVQCFS